MESTYTILLLSTYLAMSIVMGSFSITQMNYQHRMGIGETILRGLLAFVKGFFGWPVLFPLGLRAGKYKMKVVHKIGNTQNKI